MGYIYMRDICMCGVCVYLRDYEKTVTIMPVSTEI